MVALRSLSRSHASVTASQPMIGSPFLGFGGDTASLSRLFAAGDTRTGVAPRIKHPGRELVHKFLAPSIDLRESPENRLVPVVGRF